MVASVPGRLVDEISDRHIGHADASVDRRLDLGEGEIDVGLLEGGLGGAHRGRRCTLIRQVLIDRRLRDRIGLDQFLGSLQRERRVPLGRLRADQLGLSLVHRRLIGVLLDDEQEVAGLDLLPFGEGPLLQEALDARHQIDRIDRLDAADEGPGRRHALQGRGSDGHRRRGRSGRRLVGVRGASAAAKRCCNKDDFAENSPAVRLLHPRISQPNSLNPPTLRVASSGRSVPRAGKRCRFVVVVDITHSPAPVSSQGY